MGQKVAIIFYSATGNTEAMAEAVAVGAKRQELMCCWRRYLMWIQWRSATPAIGSFWAVRPGGGGYRRGTDEALL